MLWVLVKKQLMEVFKGYFYDAKKNRMRSKKAIAAWFIFFIAIMVGFFGGMFFTLADSICAGLSSAGLGWLYFLLMCGIGIALGAFGSVFNSYSGLYLSKDNDLLLSLPIPLSTILASRLFNVYLLGAIYGATALIPTLLVYWIRTGVTAAKLVCGILLFVIVTVFVMLLSCLLGWVIAKLSQKIKNKSFVSLIAMLLFIGLYYFCYFKANGFIQDIITNAESYGAKIKGSAYALYLFGRIGEGDLLAAAVFLAAVAVFFFLVWRVLHRSFLGLATAGGSSAKVRYTEKAVREKSVFGAFLAKEFGRFTSSANYMLNCGMGVLLIPASGVLLLIKGRMAFEAIDKVFASRPGSALILLCTGLCLLASMNDMATPSVSLEGKSIWIPQSLPVAPKTVLRAKLSVQLILTSIPMLFAAVCVTFIVDAGPAEKLLLCCLALVYSVFSAIAGTALGLRMPLLNWTNELAPIKQSGAVAISMFGGWGLWVVFAGIYLAVGYRIGAGIYMLAWIVIFAVAALLQLRWLDTKGAADFAAL